MKKILTILLLSTAVAVSGCASTATGNNNNYVVKINGVETNTKQSKDVNYLIPALIVGAAVGVGISLIGNSGNNDADSISDQENFQRCLASGIPESECRRIVFG